MSTPQRPARASLSAALLSALACPAAGAQAVPPANAAPAPYVDRVISASQLPALPPDEDEDAADAASQGPPRSLRIDLDAAHSTRGDEQFNEYGLALRGFRESADLGDFSLEASLFRSSRGDDRGAGGLNGSATLWQRGFALDGGWRLDNGFGVLNTPSVPLQRDQSRFFLPSAPLAGVSTDATHGRLRLQAALGRGGIATGTRILGFDAGEGHVASLSAQWAPAPGWEAAASFLGTEGRIVPDRFGEASLLPERARAVYTAAAWHGARDDVQFNLLGSGGDRRDAAGAWVDATARRGRYRHGYGAFRLEPDLGWGALPINNDVEGAYYRLGYQYGRWMWNAGLDRLRSVSADGFDGAYGTAFARYQLDTDTGVGGAVNLRRTPETSHSSQLFADRRSAWGQSRVQLDEARSSGARSWQLGVDHALALQQGARLSGSLAYGRLLQDDGGREGTVTVALSGARDVGDALTVDGNVRWTSADGISARRGLDLNLSADWRISPRWSMVASLYQSEGSRRSPFVIDPLQTQTAFISIPRQRSLFLTLRYQYEAGRARPVLGGAPGAAVGRVRGSVYLDDNADGVRGASESPAANVTVILDGRYSLRTDDAGRFDFPRVAVGTHVVTVQPDNLPLPWTFDGDNALRRIEVTVRDTVQVDLGAQRPR